MSIVSYKEFDINNVIFDPVRKIVKDAINFQRINIKYVNKDGKADKLSVQTPELFCWGIQEAHAMGKSADLPPDNYKLPLVLYDARDNKTGTEEEIGFMDMLDQIMKKIKAHLNQPETMKELGKYDLGPFVDRMTIYYRKKEKGVVVPGYAPTIYGKLYTLPQKDGKAPIINSGFYDSDDNQLDPSTLIGARCRCICDMIIDNIYIGKEPSVQIKINDCIVMSRVTKTRRLFAPIKQPTNNDCVFDDITSVDA